MTHKQVKQLRPGDAVYWQDPDDGLCSRTLDIASITVIGETVQITDTDGTYLECYADELE